MKHSLTKTNRVGLILRVYARRKEDVQTRVEQVRECLLRAAQMGVFSRVDVMVWADPSYPSDCGETEKALRHLNSPSAAWKEFKHFQVNIHEVKKGDLFCGLLNLGIALQARDRVDYSVILSPDAFSYFTPETMSLVFDAAKNGCRAIGVAINELRDSVLEGRIANTFAMWRTVSLLSVGGFDLRAAHAREGSGTRYLKGFDQEGKEICYPVHGVEEIIPLCRLVETWKPCIGTVLPQGAGIARYVAPDPVKDPQDYARHAAKMDTKLQRQIILAALAGYDLSSFLRKGIKIGALTYSD